MTPAAAKSSAQVERVVEVRAAAKTSALVERFVQVPTTGNVKHRVRQKSHTELRPLKKLRGWR